MFFKRLRFLVSLKVRIVWLRGKPFTGLSLYYTILRTNSINILKNLIRFTTFFFSTSFSILSKTILIYRATFYLSFWQLLPMLINFKVCCYGTDLTHYHTKPHFDALNPFPNKPWFLRVCNTSLLKTLQEKEKLLVTSNFSLSHRVFNPFRELSVIFTRLRIVVCKLFQF